LIVAKLSAKNAVEIVLPHFLLKLYNPIFLAIFKNNHKFGSNLCNQQANS
jgi:hypothetical protein